MSNMMSANSLGAESSPSLSDVRPPLDRTYSHYHVSSSKLSQVERRSSLPKTPSRGESGTPKRYGEISRTPLRNGPLSQVKTKTPRAGKHRLAWLDGSRSRQGSVPTVPGAFLEENPTVEPKANDKVGKMASEPVADAGYSISEPTVESTASNEPSAHIKDSLGTNLGEREVSNRAAGQMGQTSEIDRAERESNAVLETQANSQHPLIAPPLIAMARELYRTDSSAFSDSEASLRGDRRRALYDAMSPRAPSKSALSVETSQEQNILPNIQDEPSPKTAAGPGNPMPTPSSSTQRASSSQPANNATSMTVQPIRSKKVAMTVDDLPPGKVSRNHSISLQPIKSRTASRTLGENVTDKGFKRSTPSPPVTPSPVAPNLRQSIAGLESLMQEAMIVAVDAAEQNKSDEITAILDEARFAIHKASVVQEKQEMAISRRNRNFGSSTNSSCSSCSESNSLSRSKKMFRHSKTVPAHTTGDEPLGLEPSSPQPGPRTVWDEDWPYHRLQTRHSAVDWAYPRQHHAAGHGPPEATDGRNRANRTRTSPELLTLGIISKQTADTAKCSLHPSDEICSCTRQKNVPTSLPTSTLMACPRQGGLEGTDSPQPVGASKPTRSTVVGDHSPANIALSQAPAHELKVENWGRDKFDEKDYAKTSDTLKGKHHLTLKEGEHFSIHHGHVRQPIARNWSSGRKRFTAITACLNTALIGVLIGIYAGEVPAIQYTLADTMHHVILGNVCLYIGMGITTFLFWPLPLLHGRKPYTLMALGIALPLQIPQAIIVSERRGSELNYSGYMTGLLLSRGMLGLVLGFAHINFKSTLLDLYGASLQSEFPHGETVIVDDVRRHGGGMGYWLGIWSFCFIGSLAFGFLIGADVISGTNVSWGFYISVMLIAAALFLNVVTPETRRSPHRRTMQEIELPNDSISRRVARGEIKMHVSGDGPKWWWEEVFAGVYLSFRMLAQSGFLVMAVYVGWIYAEIVLIIVLLGNLLSAQYSWRPEYVGLGVLSVAVGALLAIPNSKANFFSRSRIHGPRTDSMTFQPRFTWTSHSVRRALFMISLPVAGLAYTLASQGKTVHYMVPVVFAGMIGYMSNLGMAECNGIIMENFDTSDLQPGTNSRHRLQSLAPTIKRRRTTYSSYPRVSAGFFTSQSLGFFFAAAATGVGGAVTRTVGAQKSTAITAGTLLALTLFLTCVLVRFRVVQVIPNELFGSYFGSANADRKKSTASIESDRSWRAVVIGNPSGKYRRMNWLELGSLSRWTEIRRLNRLLSRSTTQALNPGWR